MRRFITLLITITILSSCFALANGLSLNSPGPKALGMGGAFIGIADDLSAIYWNPAGLTQNKVPTVSLYYTGVMPASTYKLEEAQIDAKGESNLYHVPGFFAAWPCQLVDNLTMGIGVFVPAGLGTEWNGADLSNLSGGTEYEWMSQIGVVEIAPTIAYEFNEMFSLGAAFNIHYGMVDIKQFNVGQYEEESTGMGYGVTIGAMIKPMKDLSIGFTFKSENSIAFEGTAKNSALSGLYPTFGLTYKDADITRDIAWPMWVGGGIAYKPIDKLTVAFDVQYSQWSATQDEIETTYENWVDLTELATTGNQETMKEKLILHWIDAVQIRFGAQYDVNEELAVRAGFYIDPAPAPDETLTILFPSQNYNAVTFGFSYAMGNMGLDFGLEYLMSDDRVIPYPTTEEQMEKYADAMPGIHNSNIVAFSLGFYYSFGECKEK